MATAAKQRKAQARKAQVRKARVRNTQQHNNTPRHIQHADNGAELVSFYWGWKADQPEGFEFSNIQLINIGMSAEMASHIGASIKKICDQQLLQVINNNTGMSTDMFIMREERILIQAVNEYNEKLKNPVSFEDLLEYIVLICCAISTLVAAGKIPQDTWNGDSFAYRYTGDQWKKDFA